MTQLLDHFLAMAKEWPFGLFLELWVIGCVAGVLFKIANRILRTINVAVRGWPPEHLDADGDWKPEAEKSEPSHG